MNKRTVILIACLIATRSAWTQQDTLFSFYKSIHGDIVSFAVDDLENVFLISSSNQVKKLNANGDSVAVFNDVKKYGEASLIDVSNPLKILLYYRDFGTIVVLDRYLNVRNTIDLRKQNILQVKAVSQSYDNKIWLYDEVENKLKKIDEDGRLLLATPDFRQLFDKAPSPQKIVDEDKYVYLCDSTQEVLVFDYYGTFKTKIPLRGWQNMRISGHYVYGSKNGMLHRYDMRTFREEQWNLPPELTGALAFDFSTTHVYALRKDRVDIYNFRQVTLPVIR